MFLLYLKNPAAICNVLVSFLYHFLKIKTCCFDSWAVWNKEKRSKLVKKFGNSLGLGSGGWATTPPRHRLVGWPTVMDGHWLSPLPPQLIHHPPPAVVAVTLLPLPQPTPSPPNARIGGDDTCGLIKSNRLCVNKITTVVYIETGHRKRNNFLKGLVARCHSFYLFLH